MRCDDFIPDCFFRCHVMDALPIRPRNFFPEVKNELQQEMFDVDRYGDPSYGVEVLPRDVNSGYDGSRVDEQRRMLALSMMAECLPIRAICRATRMSHHTLMRLVEASPEVVATHKDRLRSKLRHVQTLMVDRLIDEVDSIPIQYLSLSTCQITDKLMLLDGEPTVRIEVAGPKLDDIKRAMAGPIVDCVSTVLCDNSL